ncbi:hypothetical protein [Natrinema sp. CBA1119]|uniref:hypothetical protein n=1 Tax=Natrinema sp. CBA1119 TaxID=1608465 RepID=UPI00159BDF2C|nr:hypothetical protein [Natrinema sp. CBA1119]
MYVERGGNQLATGLRLEEETVSTGGRESNGESNDTVFWVCLFGVNVKICEVTVSKRYEVAECTEIRIEMSDAASALMHLELDIDSLTRRDLV